MKEYKRLANVLAEALRVEDEEPKSSNAYVMALNTLKEDSRRGGRYGSSPHGGRPVGGLQDPVGKIPSKLRKERLRREALAAHEASPSQEKALASVFAAQPHKKKKKK